MVIKSAKRDPNGIKLFSEIYMHQFAQHAAHLRHYSNKIILSFGLSSNFHL